MGEFVVISRAIKIDKIFGALLFLFVATSCTTYTNIRPVDSSLKSPRPITVMSYNIRIGAGLTDYGASPYELKDEIELNLKPIAVAIRSIDPDIVGLQEVLGEGQAAELGKSLNMNYAYIPHGDDVFGAWWGVAVLSKYPILKIERHEISSGRGNTRSNLIADIDIYGNKVSFISIHKDRDQTEGLALYRTMKRIKSISNPVVLIGDLNVWPSDERLEIFTEHMLDTAENAETKTAEFATQRGTYPGEEGDSWGKRIDYILVEKGRFEVLDAGLIEEKYWKASDHLGYYAKLKLQHLK